MKAIIDEINKRIETASATAKKNSKGNGEVTLVAVSKTHPYERILEAQHYGLNVFGENKVQELVDKYPNIKNATWHLIGHLQRNKVKYIIDKVDMIHSVDSLELASEIDKRAAMIGIKMRVLIQINIGKEASKGGILAEELDSFVMGLSKLQNLKVSGLMTIPPVCSDPEITRHYFREMYRLYNSMKHLEYENFDIKYLSMGMTDDYEIAIEEGANIIRIGTGIFGKRDYSSIKENQ